MSYARGQQRIAIFYFKYPLNKLEDFWQIPFATIIIIYEDVVVTQWYSLLSFEKKNWSAPVRETECNTCKNKMKDIYSKWQRLCWL